MNRRQRDPAADDGTIVARNPRARHDYHILDTWEAGIVLTGTEIKAVRQGKVSLKEAHGVVLREEVWLAGMTISPYASAGYVSHDPVRRRKLLLHRQEIRRLIGAVQEKGLTLIPLDLHIARGRAKIRLALGRGKKLHDKRADLKRKDAEREARRAVGKRS